MIRYYYSPTTDQTYSPDQMLNLFGIDTITTSIPILNLEGFYPVQESSPTFDLQLYNATSTWSIIPLAFEGEGAIRVWSAVPKPLPEAKENASTEVKNQSNAQAESLVSSSGVHIDIWAGAASQDPLDRPPVYNALLGEMASIGDSLAAKLTAIDTATTVDEINDIVNPPSGIINTGRGSGLGPEDLNPSYFVEFNSMTLTPDQIELYVPGTDTVIPYDPFLPEPYQFDSFGNCFNLGDYVMQIRVAATSEIIAEFEVPLNEFNEDVSF
jgi:hypothetical protein